jgi:ubiquinone/menaquinone biosynthesis C-methylase UbiE
MRLPRRPRKPGQPHPLASWIDADLHYGRDVVERFLRRASPWDTVVDLGAGWGHDLRIARSVNPTARLAAVECMDSPMPALEKIADQIVRANIEIDPLPFEDESVDIFIANQVLEHTKEIFWILHEVSRCLRVGGHLIIGVPNLASLHNRLLLLAGRHPTQMQLASAHVRGFSRHDLLRFFEKCHPGGYRLEDWAGSQFYPFPRPAAKLLARLAPGMAYSMFVLLKKQGPYARQFADYPGEADLHSQFHTG